MTGGRAADPQEPFPVLYRDAALLAIAKPPGILTVPPTTGGARNVADALRRRAAAAGERIFPVHRLDRDTSGVLLFARTEAARRALDDAFRTRAVRKRYLAIVQGRPARTHGTIRSFIVDRGDQARSSPRPVPAGREAVTRYRVLESFAAASLVEAEPETGRFNQIRLHCADLGCPLVGERKYAVGSRATVRFKRPLLHAAALTFSHPTTGGSVTVTADPPADFATFLAGLRL